MQDRRLFRRQTLALVLANLLASAAGHAVEAPVATTTAPAQSGEAAKKDAATSIAFTIPAQPLDRALEEWSKQSGMQVLKRDDSPAAPTLQSTPVSGRLTPALALQKLLEGTGLKFQFVNDHTVRISAQGSSPVTSSAPPVNTTDQKAPPAVAIEEDAAEAGPGLKSGVRVNVNQQASHPRAAGEPVDITGRVVSSTGYALPGALIKVAETKQTVVTDKLGEFHLSQLPPADYTVTITYIGYAQLETRIDATDPKASLTAMEYVLEPNAWHLEEITVYGNRSARSKSLNAQRAAENDTEVTSADTLGNFAGTTLSEALRRVPGVAFEQDPTTGDGTNIIIRGLSADYNTIQLNGLILPSGDGVNRGTNLNNFLADSVSKITINKSLLPSMDGTGTGGLVQIETKTPLERDRRYANISIEGADRAEGFSNDRLFSGTLSGSFGGGGTNGDDQFGLSASVQDRDHKVKAIAFNETLAFGEYLPLVANPFDSHGAVSYPGALDPTVNFPYEKTPGASNVYVTGNSSGVSIVDQKTLTMTVSGEWKPAQSTHFNFDFTHAKAETDSFSGFASFSVPNVYQWRPVADLGGASRYAVTYDDFSVDPNNIFTTADRNVSAQQTYNQLEGQSTTTDVYSLRGQTHTGKWDLDYTLGLTSGRADPGQNSSLSIGIPQTFPPASLDPGFVNTAALNPNGGVIVSPYGLRQGSGVQLPLLTAAGWNYFNTPSNYNFNYGFVPDPSANSNYGKGSNDRRTLAFNVKYNLDLPFISYVQMGVNYERSQFKYNFPALLSLSSVNYPAPSAEQLGLVLQPTDLTRVGVNAPGFYTVSQAGLRAFFANLSQYTSSAAGLLALNSNPSVVGLDQQYTNENVLASYLQVRMAFGKLEVIAGPRIVSTQVTAHTLVGPHLIPLGSFMEDPAFAEQYSHFADLSGTQTDVLPRVVLNYRQTDDLIYRASYSRSVARPSVTQLNSSSGGTSETLNLNANGGPLFNQSSLTVSLGNAGLKPAITDNYDAGVEYYSNDIGLLKFSGYYKHIKNLIELNSIGNLQDLTGIPLPDAPEFQTLPPNTYVSVQKPINNPYAAHIWGLEGSVERRFNFLPGWLSGFGVYANVLVDRSRKQSFYNYYPPGASGPVTVTYTSDGFSTSPPLSGTFALTYERNGLDAALSYGFQDRYLMATNGSVPNNLDSYNEVVRTVDLKAAYQFNWKGVILRASFQALNLLQGANDAQLLQSQGGSGGAPVYYTGGTYLGGREFRLGLSGTL